MRELRGHAGVVKDIGFSADGRWIVSGGEDGSVRVWEAASGRRVAEHWAEGAPVEVVAFTPDGTRIFSARTSGAVHLVRCDACVSLDELVALARGRLTRTLTCDERRIFLHETTGCR